MKTPGLVINFFWIILFFIIGIFFWNKKKDAYDDTLLPPCFRISAPMHHYFEPNCSGSFSIFNQTINYSINEDGLRDRSRKEIKEKQVLVLGDSMVEGWGLPQSKTISRELENHFASSLGYQFINAGIRYSGPILQSVRAQQLLDIYKPKKILWFLTENDLADDRFSYALATKFDENHVPSEFSIKDFEDTKWVENFQFLQKISPALFRLLRQEAYKKSVNRIVNETLDYPVCAGIQRLEQNALKQGVDIFYIILPLGEKKIQDISALVKCIAADHIIDIRESLNTHKEYFFPNNIHFNEKGVDAAVSFIADDIKRFLSK